MGAEAGEEMTPMEKRLAAMEKLIPKSGFNLVGVDTFEDAGEELFLIGNFKTRAAAEAELAKRRKDNDEPMYIYGPGDA